MFKNTKPTSTEANTNKTKLFRSLGKAIIMDNEQLFNSTLQTCTKLNVTISTLKEKNYELILFPIRYNSANFLKPVFKKYEKYELLQEAISGNNFNIFKVLLEKNNIAALWLTLDSCNNMNIEIQAIQALQNIAVTCAKEMPKGIKKILVSSCQWAIARGKTEICKDLLTTFDELNITKEVIQTLLQTSARNGQTGILNLLIDKCDELKITKQQLLRGNHAIFKEAIDYASKNEKNNSIHIFIPFLKKCKELGMKRSLILSPTFIRALGDVVKLDEQKILNKLNLSYLLIGYGIGADEEKQLNTPVALTFSDDKKKKLFNTTDNKEIFRKTSCFFTNVTKIEKYETFISNHTEALNIIMPSLSKYLVIDLARTALDYIYDRPNGVTVKRNNQENKDNKEGKKQYRFSYDKELHKPISAIEIRDKKIKGKEMSF